MPESLETIADELIERYRTGEPLDTISLPEEVTDFRGRISLVIQILSRGGSSNKTQELVDHLMRQATPEGAQTRDMNPNDRVHVIVEDGFPGSVTGELCPESGLYTTRAGLEEILKGLGKCT